eukprot:TRINITY_DN16911_c1_g1_i1.p1 TRINITY_DN16911_c1_g1~~TRINITY_DN16911_c1_g1_i1.p1  ORF type:complete len:490 (+),score=108.79 TRINITY_DN16911_c1_g1_i1:44-1513(+)
MLGKRSAKDPAREEHASGVRKRLRISSPTGSPASPMLSGSATRTKKQQQQQQQSVKKVQWGTTPQVSYFSHAAPPTIREDALQMLQVANSGNDEQALWLLKGLISANFPNSRFEMEQKGARIQTPDDLLKFVSAGDVGLRLHFSPGEPLSINLLQRFFSPQILAASAKESSIRTLIEQRCWEDLEEADAMKELTITRELMVRGVMEIDTEWTLQDKVEHLLEILDKESRVYDQEDADLDQILTGFEQDLQSNPEHMRKALKDHLRIHFQEKLEILGISKEGTLEDLAFRLEMFRRLQEASKFKLSRINLEGMSMTELLQETEHRNLAMPANSSREEILVMLHRAIIDELPKLPIKFEIGTPVVDLEDLTLSDLQVLQQLYEFEVPVPLDDPLVSLTLIRKQIMDTSAKVFAETVVDHIAILTKDDDNQETADDDDEVVEVEVSIGDLVLRLEQLLKEKSGCISRHIPCCSCGVFQIAYSQHSEGRRESS